MTGAPRHLTIDGDFVLLRMALIDEVGLVPAVVFQRIAWRCDVRPEGWQASLDEIAAECRLGKDQIKRATKTLRDLGWVTADRDDRWDPTLRWRVVWNPTSREVENPPHEEAETTPSVKVVSPLTEKVVSPFTSLEDVEDSKNTSTSTTDVEDTPPARDDVERLCEHLAARIVTNGGKPPRITKGWRDAARLLIDRDGHTEEKIHRAIDWCQDDEFWRGNVLSMPTLRKQYDRLRLQAQRGGPRGVAHRAGIERTADGSGAGHVEGGRW